MIHGDGSCVTGTVPMYPAGSGRNIIITAAYNITEQRLTGGKPCDLGNWFYDVLDSGRDDNRADY